MLKAGELVELRPADEILATLDEKGSLDGLPFMPEMLSFFGRQFRVQGRVGRACDTISVDSPGLRNVPDAVVLDDLRCDGAAHRGCQAQCRLFWKESWLRPVETPRQDESDSGRALVELERRVSAGVEGPDSSPGEPVFSCQATELLRASEPIGWWDMRSFLSEPRTRNVSLWRFIRVMARIVVEETALRLGLMADRPFPDAKSPVKTSATPRGLLPGDLVRVRTKSEIAPTIDATGKTRGLWFDREMLPYCGKTARVKMRVEKFVDERTGRMVHLGSGCYILEGVGCSGELSRGRWFCCRAIYPWWREAWLERIESE